MDWLFPGPVSYHKSFVAAKIRQSQGDTSSYYWEHYLDCTLAQHLQQLPPLKKGD
jgi:hypothetical protein